MSVFSVKFNNFDSLALRFPWEHLDGPLDVVV